MANHTKLTTNSEESDVSGLLSGDSIFSIPYFQRPYKWKKARIDQFQSDLLSLIDDESMTHFLGALIIHGRKSSPSDPNIYEVIDGQQRITTIYLYLSAGIKTLSDHGILDDAVSLFQKYLAIGRNVKFDSNFKIHSSKDDRAQLNLVLDDLQKNSEFAVKLGPFAPRKLTSTGNENGALIKNYYSAKRFFRDQIENYGPDRIHALLSALLQRVSVVQIDVVDPTNGPKIFDSLNSRQEPMTVGDLVRNEIFSRASGLSPEEIDYLDHFTWQPFYKGFVTSDSTSLFESYFFPFGLIQNSNLSKSQVYAYLQKKWAEQNDPALIVKELSYFQDAFLDLMKGTNEQELPNTAFQAIARFRGFGFPTSALPFLMQLTKAMKTGILEIEEGIRMLNVVESFLVRRALCRIEPTGLHAVFKRLWDDRGSEKTASSVSEKIKDKSTVLWPDDEMVERSIRTKPLYGSNVAQFVIRQYDHSLGGDIPDNIPWIEHILPRNPDQSWDDVFPKDDRSKVVDTWANLIPLSASMNGDLSNQGYHIKRANYQEDAMFKSARKLAAENVSWNPEALDKRADHLVAWALQRWPG